MQQDRTTYGLIDRVNHWLVAVAVVGLLTAGWILYLGMLDRSTAGELRNMHKAIGVCVLAFGFWRVGYRLVKGFPQSAGTGAAWQALGARLAHWVLLAGILIMPLSGLAKGYFAGRATDMFGLFSIPGAGIKSEALGEFASAVHFLSALLITGVLALHIVAALKHHFIDRDATLVRMLTGRTGRGRT